MNAILKPLIPQASILDLDDPVTYYAQRVVAGEIVAGPHVRDACARHLRDLENAHERGLYWDLEAARYAIEFFPAVLRLNGGKFEGIPFELELWQGFIVGSIHGWRWQSNGLRRFQLVYIETAKGSGKSPLAAGLGLFGLIADGEQRAEVYAAATKMDQAKILFRDAVSMVDQSPELNAVIHRSGSRGKEWNLAYHETSSFFKPISADDGQSGPRPHIGLLDEVHEHKNANVIEMMRAGFKFREQPLLIMITNSGSDRKSICWNYHKYGADICGGTVEDDTFFAYICALDPGEDPFTNEACWIKANPSLGVTVQEKYLRDQVVQARKMPAKASLVKRLNFCIWTESLSPWIGYEVWRDAGNDPIDNCELYGRRCFAGLDLSSTTDLTAFVLLFEPIEDDPYWRMVPFFWLPSDGLSEKSEKDQVPYAAWVEQGYLETTPGAAISTSFVLQRIVQICDLFDVDSISFDRWRIEQLKQTASDEGYSLPPMKEFGQGFKDMAPAVDEFERLLLNSQLRHNNNPVLNWNAGNAVIVSDPANNRKVAKNMATGRVDGIVAGVMAAGATISKNEGPSIYEDRGILIL